MDWIDEKIEFFRRKIHNMSLKRALGAYIVIAILAFVPCYLSILVICNTWKTTILSKYTKTIEGVLDSMKLNFDLQNIADALNISAFDQKILTVIQIAQTLSIFILVALAIALTSHFYYKIGVCETPQAA